MHKVKNVIRYILAEILILVVLVMSTKGDLMFHISEPIPLTAELISKKANLTYDQLYTIDHPMRYRLNIESEDGEHNATLVWPQSPFGSFFILTSSENPDLNTQTQFAGRLVRCVYKCLPDDMLIEMFSFVDTLEKKFPTLKGKYSKLPSIILNTYEQPGGWKTYFELTRYYWSFYAFALIFGGVLLLKSVFKKPQKYRSKENNSHSPKI